jgi:hypothetical protein
VNFLRILNCIAYIGISFGFVVTGFITSTTTRAFKEFFNRELPGKPLPNLTEFVLAYGTSETALVANLILGVFFVGLLFFLESGEQKRKQFVPICMAAAFSLVFVQLGSILLGIAMPSFPIIEGMSNAGVAH